MKRAAAALLAGFLAGLFGPLLLLFTILWLADLVERACDRISRCLLWPS